MNMIDFEFEKSYYGQYPEEKAFEEAVLLREKTISGEAKDYQEADSIIEEEWREKPADIILIEPPSPSPMVGFSIGLASLGANLEAATNQKAGILDCNIAQKFHDESGTTTYNLINIFQDENGNKNRVFDCERLAEMVKKEYQGVKVFGIKSVTPTHPEARTIAKIIKKECPQAKVIVGGPHASSTSREILENNEAIDVIVRGEGEQTLIELMKSDFSDEQLLQIKGLTFRNNEGRIIHNPERPIMTSEELGELTYKYDRLINRSRYIAELHNGQKSATVITSRGCPFRCSFCSSCQHWGRETRFRPIDGIMGELEDLVLRKGISKIYFEDDIFNLDLNRIEQLCDAIIKKQEQNPDFKFNFHCECRIDIFPDNDLLLEHILQKMKDGGCDDIFFGLESFDEKPFKATKTGGRIQDFEKYKVKVARIFAACQKIGIGTTASMMVGLPLETDETKDKTIEMLAEIRPTRIYFSFLSLYPGAPLFEDYAKEKGFEWLRDLLRSDIYEQYTEEPEITAQLGLITGHGVRGIKPRYIKRDVFMSEGRIEYDFDRMRSDFEYYRKALETKGLKIEIFEHEMGLQEQK